MAEHSSDCELYNAPALPPAACSCGVSPTFRAYDYDVTQDVWAWRRHSRESYISECAGRTLGMVFAKQRLTKATEMIHRAFRCGLTGNELRLVREAWERNWEPRDAAYLARLGIDDVFLMPDGRKIDDALRASLAFIPTEAEMRTALEPWFEYWATLPEPHFEKL